MAAETNLYRHDSAETAETSAETAETSAETSAETAETSAETDRRNKNGANFQYKKNSRSRAQITCGAVPESWEPA